MARLFVPSRTTSLVLLLWLIAPSVQAQSVRGVVVDSATNSPIPAAFVVLLDSAGSRLAGALTGADGTYAVRAAVPGSYRLRVEQIGRASATSPVLTLTAAAPLSFRFEVAIKPIVLEAIVVTTGDEQCRMSESASRAALTLWDEARKALEIAVWTEKSVSLPWRVAQFDRVRDVVNDRIIAIDTNTRRLLSGTGDRPFYSASVDEIAEDGYIRRLPGDEYQYFALDTEALLSEAFLDSHCIRAVAERPGEPDHVGIGFEPVPGKVEPDVAGVIWLDRSTFELRDVEFRYTRHLHATDIPDEAFGGRASFRRLDSGAWLVDRWHIRMPQFVQLAVPPVSIYTTVRRPTNETERRAAARDLGMVIREQGGELLRVVAPGGRQPGGQPDGERIEGVVYDSTRQIPLTGAIVYLTDSGQFTRSDSFGRFSLRRVASGDHEIGFLHPYADSLAMVAATRRVRAGERTVQLSIPADGVCQVPEDDIHPTGGVIGFAEHDVTGDVMPGAVVTARWTRRRQNVWEAMRGLGWQEKLSAEGVADQHGRFMVCGLPIETEVTLQVGSAAVVKVTLDRAATIRRDVIGN